MTIERLPLTPAQQDAFRAYMHGLNRQAAIAQGADPDDICPECGESLSTEHTPEARAYHKKLSGLPLDLEDRSHLPYEGTESIEDDDDPTNPPILQMEVDRG